MSATSLASRQRHCNFTLDPMSVLTVLSSSVGPYFIVRTMDCKKSASAQVAFGSEIENNLRLER